MSGFAWYWSGRKYVWALRSPACPRLWSERSGGKMKVYRLMFGWRITARPKVRIPSSIFMDTP